MTAIRTVFVFLARLVWRLLRGSVAAAILGVVVAGLPWLLVTKIGWPLPDHVPTTWDQAILLAQTPYDIMFVFRALAVLTWLFWARLMLAVLVETIDTTVDVITRTETPHVPRSTINGMAAVLVGAVLGLLMIDLLRGAVRAGTSTAAPAPPVGAVAAATHQPDAPGLHLDHGSDAPRVQVYAAVNGRTPTASTVALAVRPDTPEPDWVRQARTDGHPIYVVQPGDNLTSIAERQLGDGQRWRDIYVLNRGKPQPTGYALTNPDEIDRTWYLALPAPPAAPTVPAAGASEGPDDRAPLGNQSAAPTIPTVVPTAPARSASPSSPAQSPTPQSSGHDDGVAAPPTASSPPASASTSPTRPASPTTLTSTPAMPAPATRHAGTAIDLPSGAWLSAGLVAGLAGLASAIRLQRRRRYRPGRPTPLTVRAVEVMPDALRIPSGRTGYRLDEVPEPLPATVGTAHTPDGGDGVEIGLLDLTGTGVALTGPGAVGAARAVIASALSASPLVWFDDRAEIGIAADLLAELAPGWTPTELPRLHVMADPDTAVADLEREVVCRRGHLRMVGAESHAAFRAVDDFHEPLGPYVLVARANSAHRHRLAAVLDQAAAMRLGVVLLGDLADVLPGVVVAHTGTVTAVHGHPGLAVGARLSTLTATDLAEILAVLPEATYSPDEPEPEPEAEAAVDVAVGTAAGTGDAVARTGAVEVGHRPQNAAQVVLFGKPTLTVGGQPVSYSRVQSCWVVGYLASRTDGATLDELVGYLLPENDPKGAKAILRNAMSDLRAALRPATGLKDANFVRYDNHRYWLEDELLDIDVWQLHAALTTANTTTDDAVRLAALYEAAGLYCGPYCDDADGEWFADNRVRYHRQAVDILARIAELEEPDRPDAALAALDSAVGLDPHNEFLYQQIMTIQGRLGRLDAVRRTRNLLDNRLMDIDAEITDATRDLFRSLTRSRTPR